MSLVERTCKWRKCKAKFMAREADVKRGWAKFCSKFCKAKEQESRTRQNAAFQQRREMAEAGECWGGPFSNEEHDCNKGDGSRA